MTNLILLGAIVSAVIFIVSAVAMVRLWLPQRRGTRMPDDYDMAEKWAIDRIGKRVFRGPNSCGCDTCKGVSRNGLVIMDRWHATFITDHAMEMGYRYADSIEDL